MIGDVKELCPELQFNILLDREILKYREVHPAVSGSWHLGSATLAPLHPLTARIPAASWGIGRTVVIRSDKAD